MRVCVDVCAQVCVCVCVKMFVCEGGCLCIKKSFFPPSSQLIYPPIGKIARPGQCKNMK